MSYRYTTTAITIHWIMALAFFVIIALGFYMTGLGFSPEKLKLVSWHKWLGVSLFLLAVLRLLWRATHQPPPLPASMSAQAKLLAHLGHYALYFFMFSIPLSGWLMSSAMGVPTVWFGVVPLPDLIPKHDGLKVIFQNAHFYLNYAFIAAIVGHIAAALKHQFIDKDDLFARIK